MAALGYVRQGDEDDKVHWMCAGGLLTDQHIVTAASCVQDTRQFNMYYIVVLELYVDYYIT